MKSISSIISFVPISSDKYDLDQAIEFAMQALDLLEIKQAYEEKVVYNEFDNYKLKLPIDFKSLNQVFICIASEPEPSQFSNQAAFENTWQRASEATRSAEMQLRNGDCEKTNDCPTLFKVTPDRHLLFSKESGKVIIVYNSYTVSESGDILIPDDAQLEQAIATYVTMKLTESFAHNHEQNMYNMFREYSARWQNLYNTVVSRYRIFDLDPEAIMYYSERNLDFMKNQVFIDKHKLQGRIR